jgi:hypothetical protein
MKTRVRKIVLRITVTAIIGRNPFLRDGSMGDFDRGNVRLNSFGRQGQHGITKDWYQRFALRKQRQIATDDIGNGEKNASRKQP